MLVAELNGNTITNNIISYERNLSLCDGIGTVTLIITPPGFSFTTWDEVEVWEDGNKKGLFYITSFEKLEDSAYKLICQDGSKRLNDYYVDDVIETSEITNTKDWLIYFLDLAGVNYVFDTLEPGHSLPEDSSFGPDQVLNIIEPLLMENGWFLFFNENGIAHITPVSLDPESPSATLESDRIITLTSRIDDSKARNRVVVWNPAKGYIAEATASTSWQVDSNDLRSVGITSSYIRNDYHAQLIANRILQVFRDPEHTKVVEVEGEVNVFLADAVRIRTPYFTGNCVVTSISVRFDRSGFITTLTLDEKCPRLVGIFEYAGYVYIGTWGAGIWRKPLSGSTWESYSAGLGSLEIIDLSIANGIFACVANNGYLYIREFADSAWRLYSTPTFVDQDAISYSNTIATACKVDVNTGNIYATYSVTAGIELRSWVEQLNIFGSHLSSQQVYFQENQDYWTYDLDKNNFSTILSAYTGDEIALRPSTNVIKPSFPLYRMNVAIDGQNRCIGPATSEVDLLDGFIETFKWGGGTNMASQIVVYEEKVFFLENNKFTYINTSTYPSVRRDWYVPVDTSGGVAGGIYGVLARQPSGTVFDFVRVKNTPGSIGEPSSPGLYLIYTLEHFRLTFNNIDLQSLVSFQQFPSIVMFREGGSALYPYESNAANYDPLRQPMYHNGKIAFFWAGLFNNESYGSLSLIKNFNFKSATYNILTRQFTKSDTLAWPGSPSPGTSGIVFDLAGVFPNVSLSLAQESSNFAIWLINANMINGSGPCAGIFYYAHSFDVSTVDTRIQRGITSSWLYPWINSLHGNQFVKLTSFTKSTREYTFRFQYAYSAYITDYYLCNGIYLTRDIESRQKYGVFAMRFDGSLEVVFEELDVYNGVKYEDICDGIDNVDNLDYGSQGFGYNKAPIADLNLEFSPPRYTYGSKLMDATQINNQLGTIMVDGNPINIAHRDVSHQDYFNLDLCDYYDRRFYVIDNRLFKIYGFNLDNASLESTIINVPSLTVSQSHMMVGNYIFSTNGYRNGGDFVVFDSSLWFTRIISNHTLVTGGGGYTLLEISDYRRNVEATTDGYLSTFTLPLPSGGLPGGIIGALNPGEFLTDFYVSNLSQVSIAPFFGVNDVKVPYVIASGFYTISGEVGLIGDVALIASGEVLYAKQLPFLDQLFDNYHVVVLSSGGPITHLEVSNTFELPFLFYSVSHGSGVASGFYQRNPEEISFASYSAGLPSSDITIIRLDDSL